MRHPATLSLDIDEGAIDGVVFQGIDEKLARTFADEFALRAGDVFNSRRARQALDVLLQADARRRQCRPASTRRRSPTAATCRQRRGTFDLVDRNGERILLVGLREPPGRFRIVPDLGEREDWFSSVDGFVPSLGMGIAVFDHDRFNHTFVAGHLSYKIASERAGYALGFERPLFGTTKLYVGGELHDLTASDDQWQAVVARSEPGGGRSAPQLSRLLPPPRRPDQRGAAPAPAGRGAVRVARRAPGAAARRPATSASGTATRRSARIPSRPTAG